MKVHKTGSFYHWNLLTHTNYIFNVPQDHHKQLLSIYKVFSTVKVQYYFLEFPLTVHTCHESAPENCIMLISLVVISHENHIKLRAHHEMLYFIGVAV